MAVYLFPSQFHIDLFPIYIYDVQQYMFIKFNILRSNLPVILNKCMLPAALHNFTGT